MPLPVSVDATWMNNASVSYNAQEIRRADAALFSGDGSAFGVTGGIVRHGDTSLAVTVSVADVVTVQAGAVVIPGNSGVGNGVYRCALGAADTGPLTARNATNPRIDLVVFRALDTDVVVGHGAYTGRVEILAGTPAASPVAPALPLMAVELARVTVPISGGAAATVDSTFRTFATGLGGRLAVATFARLPATDAKWDKAVALDTGLEYTWDGTAWTRSIGGWTAPVYQNGWVDFGGGLDDALGAYRKVGDTVELRGLVKNGATPAVIFTLPVGFRPPLNEFFGTASSNAYGQVIVQGSGAVSASVATTWLSLSG